MKALPTFLTLASILTLTACAADHPSSPNGSTTADTPTVATTQPAMTSSISDANATIYARLARLEADMGTMKTQMSSIGPILEKMPALQDKLAELVTELQRIDARVATTHTDATVVTAPMVPVTTSAPVDAAKTVPAPMTKPSTPTTQAAPSTTAPMTITPLVKPAPAKGLVTPASASSSDMGHETSAPEIKTTDKPTVTAAPTATTTPAKGAVVKDVRIGDTADKTRIVLDVSEKTTFSYDLDNAEKILIIDLDAPTFAAAAAAEFAKSPLVAAYEGDVGDNGKSRLILQLKKSVKVIGTQTLLPNGDKGNRIVIDLAPAS